MHQLNTMTKEHRCMPRNGNKVEMADDSSTELGPASKVQRCRNNRCPCAKDFHRNWEHVCEATSYTTGG